MNSPDSYLRSKGSRLAEVAAFVQRTPLGREHSDEVDQFVSDHFVSDRESASAQ